MFLAFIPREHRIRQRFLDFPDDTTSYPPSVQLFLFNSNAINAGLVNDCENHNFSSYDVLKCGKLEN